MLAAGLAMTLSGCGGLLHSDLPPETTYWLEPSPGDAPHSPAVAALRVEVHGTPGFESDRLLVQGPGPVMRRYANARWADTVPRVVLAFVRADLPARETVTRTMTGSSGTDDTGLLVLEVRAFNARHTGPDTAPSVELELRGYLRCRDADVPLHYREQSSAADNRLHAVVAAFQRNLDTVMGEIAADVASACSDS